MNILTYKGYTGSAEFSAEDNVFFGEVLGIKSLISYEGDSVAELKADFEGAIDDYLAECSARGITPEKPYKGSFNVRISPQLHAGAATYAKAHHMTLNAVVAKALDEFLINT